MGGNKRHRIHPAVACTAIVCLTAMAISAELHTGEPLVNLKIFFGTLIGLIAGIKVRHKVT
jgi:hypothetical protein